MKEKIINYFWKPLIIGGSFMLGVILVYAATINGLGSTINSGDTISKNWFQEVNDKLTKYSGIINIDSNNNVGIGTTSSSYKLNVGGRIKAFEGIEQHSCYRSKSSGGHDSTEGREFEVKCDPGYYQAGYSMKFRGKNLASYGHKIYCCK